MVVKYLVKLSSVITWETKNTFNELVKLSNFEAKCGNMSCLLLAVFINKIPQERYGFRQESPWVQTEFKNKERKSLKCFITYRVGKIKLFLTKSKIPGRNKNLPNFL